MSGELRRAFAYIWPYWRRLLLVLAISFVSTVVALIVPYLTKDLVDRALIGRDANALVRIVAAFIVLTLVSFGLNVASGLRYTRVSADILFDMRLAVYRHLQRLSPRFYARTRLGDIISRVNNDIGEIQRAAAEAALAWVGNAFFLAGTIGMLIWLDARLFFVTALPLPFGIWALIVHRRRLETRVADVRARSASIGSFLIETLQGVRLIVTSNAQEREAARFRKLNDEFVGAVTGMQRATYFTGGLPGLILSAGTALVFLYGGWRVISGVTTLGTFAAFMAYQMRLPGPIQGFMGLYTSLASARVSWRRVLEILDAPPEVTEAPGATPLPQARGEIDFEGVTVSFERQGAVLEHVNFHARPGEVVAIVGASGSGKSTLADLLTRLLDPDSGTIRLDGHDLRRLRLADVRGYIARVDQEPFLLHASIRENMLYARPGASEAELRHAARSAGIDAFIESLPDGYETIVGERGMALSAGQRQRIAIARAFLANPAVLVLDEPTSALDPVSERQVVDGYEAIMRGRTTILISHRLELARQADRILVIDGAHIVERGTPAELMISGGAFAHLFGLTPAHAGP
jgi:ATP-binding cassette subfamily B protein